MFTIDFEPVGRRGECPGDQSLLESARQLNVDLVSVCGGVGSCPRCRVQIISGKVSKPTPEEEAELSAREMEQGYRLACQAYPLDDVKLHIPPKSLTAIQRTQVEGLDVDVIPEPPIRTFDLSLPQPTLDFPVADDKNLWATLTQEHDIQPGSIDLAVQQTLSQQIRSANWQIRVALRGDELIAVGVPSTQWLGLAVDIGTTKIAAYLVDMESGKLLHPKA